METFETRRPVSSRWRYATAAAALGLVLAVTGCVPPFVACTTIGYVNTLKVVVEGSAASSVDDVLLCLGEMCAPSAAASDSGFFIESTVDGDTWTFAGDFPADLTARLVDADGAVISDTAIDPDWVRVGGSAACGGPAAATVTVRA